MVMDEPLDFEMEQEEDPLLAAPRPTKRKKVIGLDDLLLDYYESGKDERKGKAKRRPIGYNSEDLDDIFRNNSEKEIEICKIVKSVEEEAKKMDATEDVPLWGQKVFGCQKPPSILSDTGVENCHLLQSFSSDELLGFDLEIDKGEGFLEGLLVDGWLLKLVHISGSVEDSIVSWTLTKMLYSSNKKLQVSATDFWESILSVDEGDKLPVTLGCFPSYSVLKHAILSYGYLFDTPDTKTSISGSAADRLGDGPPENIIAWLRVVSACCKVRVSMDLNCLRIVDCITGTNDRNKFLRSQLALQLLKISFGLKVGNVEKILKLVTSINVKDKECDLFKRYVYLVLMDKLLFSTDAFRNKTMVVDSWRNYLRSCSTQIGCTDWRFYASKVRNKASYLLQRVMVKR
ncbi:hypothetical protein PR202_ga24333 [Eleusine coracana subsp. coracana]|uniref:Uncharacterized protein n=1 Tax=Eleusine coracana subsp. coracana TaxID=191504 RepID=A0AAV5D8J1_ELECO|nr:hypothetical protein PR202_ga24333 [Eleusine coracana subsp. coracana]